MLVPFNIFYEESSYSFEELKDNITDIEEELKSPCPVRAKEYGSMSEYVQMLNHKLKKYRNLLKSS